VKEGFYIRKKMGREFLRKRLLEAFEAGAERTVPDVAPAPDAEAAEEGGVLDVGGPGGGAVALFKAGEDAGAFVGEGGGALDADGPFLDSEFNEFIEPAEDAEVVTGLLRREEMDDLPHSLLVDGTIGTKRGSKIAFGVLTGAPVYFHDG
jgi:hypothetical protein